MMEFPSPAAAAWMMNNELDPASAEALLSRAPVNADISAGMGYIRGGSVLVTGAGGSVGSELCRRIAEFEPRVLIAFDIAENGVYELKVELERRFPSLKLAVHIGSVRDEARLDSVFAEFRPDCVFHAAAHKHVPLMEEAPGEAVKNNVFGTLNTARAADRYAAKLMLLISTDKAVAPTGVMGASKRLCEMIVRMMFRRSNTVFASVRFGNLLCSSGSVVPLFMKQIALGGPVTVTHPEVSRYFMTVPEAATLVLLAGAYARGGEVFVLDMGEPVRIDALARRLILLSGLTPEKDVSIVYTGLRAGEKLCEELFNADERIEGTENEFIRAARSKDVNERELMEGLERLRALADRDPSLVRGELMRLAEAR